MIFPNPTQIRRGQKATLLMAHYTVVGRAVLGIVEAGRNYYWTELYLETSSGAQATLVFEDSEQGPRWRLFTMFDPEYAITAEDAATKREGDALNLDGSTVWVTRVDKSRVWHVEGKAPEGVETGKRASYFNAEAGKRMMVISWTGDEVEYYDGNTIGAREVATAFGLSGFGAFQFTLASGRRWSNPKLIVPYLFVLAVVAVLLAVVNGPSQTTRSAPVTLISAGVSPLPTGASGTLNGVTYRVASHSLVEVGEVGARFQRHEYTLTDNDGNEVILMHGGKSIDASWLLCTPFQQPLTLTPRQAGGLRRGQIVALDNGVAGVSELFRITIRQTDNTNFLSLKAGDVLYGFNANIRSNVVMVRWNQVNITGYRVSTLAPQTVRRAFGF